MGIYYAPWIKKYYVSILKSFTKESRVRTQRDKQSKNEVEEKEDLPVRFLEIYFSSSKTDYEAEK